MVAQQTAGESTTAVAGCLGNDHCRSSMILAFLTVQICRGLASSHHPHLQSRNLDICRSMNSIAKHQQRRRLPLRERSDLWLGLSKHTSTQTKLFSIPNTMLFDPFPTGPYTEDPSQCHGYHPNKGHIEAHFPNQDAKRVLPSLSFPLPLSLFTSTLATSGFLGVCRSLNCLICLRRSRHEER